MAMNPEDKMQLQKYTMVAKKIIYDPARMKAFMKMLGSKEGAVTAVHTVVAAIDKLKPVPPQLMPLLGVNAYMLMVDVAQEVTNMKPDPGIMQAVVGTIMSEVGGQAAPAPQQGMLAQMQGQEQGEPAGDPSTPDNTPAHENAESPELEAQEGDEEDPQAGMLANMQRRGAPA
jgi:hypothetical protein